MKIHVCAHGCSSFSCGQSHHLRLTHQLRPFLERMDLTIVIHAFVIPRLDYCNAAYVGMPLKTLAEISTGAGNEACPLAEANCLEHVTPILLELPCFPVCFHAQRNVLVLPYKALYGQGSGCVKGQLFPRELAQPSCSAEKALRCVPSMGETKFASKRANLSPPLLWHSSCGNSTGSFFAHFSKACGRSYSRELLR